PRRGGAAGGGGGGAGPLLLRRVPRPGERGAAAARVPLRLAGSGAIPVRPDEPGAGAARRVLMRRRVALGALLSISAGAEAVAGSSERFDHQGAALALVAPGVGVSLTASGVSVNGIRW